MSKDHEILMDEMMIWGGGIEYRLRNAARYHELEAVKKILSQGKGKISINCVQGLAESFSALAIANREIAEELYKFIKEEKEDE